MAGTIEISVGDVTDVEARVYARYVDGGEGPTAKAGVPVSLVGNLRGPFCEGIRTLTAEFEFRAVTLDDPQAVVAEAVVTDPCMWSAEMPHLYELHVTARVGEQILAEHRGKIGLRRLAPRRPVDFAPGTG